MGKFFEAIQKGSRPPDGAAGAVPESPPAPPEPSALEPGPQTAPVADATPGPAPEGPSTPPPAGPAYDRIAPEMIVIHRPQSFEGEQFKLLRTQLLFPKTGRPPRTMMVTSALPGEGKSFVSANLAASIAQNINEHVLLIDCDMRRPTVHRLFGHSADAPGLSAYLTDGGSSLADLLVKTPIEKLTLLPGGRPPANPSELLSSQRMAELIEEVRGRYPDRYIIFDAPPPKLISEANALARKVDGILLVARYGKTPRSAFKDLVESLGKEKIIGTVINRFDIQLGSFYNDYYKYRRYGRYYQ